MSIDSIVVLVLLVIPGLIGDHLYRFLLWRREPSGESKTIRALVFSTCGLLLILLARAAGIGLTFPLYLFPEWWSAGEPRTFAVEEIAHSWVVHVIATLIFSLIAVGVVSHRKTAGLVQRIAKQSLYEDTWQEFAETYFERYVLLETQAGTTYYGKLGVVSGHDDRSIVLWNPTTYEVIGGVEMIDVAGTEAIYIPHNQVASIKVPHVAEQIEKSRSLFGKYNLSTGERIR